MTHFNQNTVPPKFCRGIRDTPFVVGPRTLSFAVRFVTLSFVVGGPGLTDKSVPNYSYP